MPFLGSAVTMRRIGSGYPRPTKVSRSESHLDARARLLNEISVWLERLDQIDLSEYKEQLQNLGTGDVETLLNFIGVNVAYISMLDGREFAEKVEDRIKKRVRQVSMRIYGYVDPTLLQRFQNARAEILRSQQR